MEVLSERKGGVRTTVQNAKGVEVNPYQKTRKTQREKCLKEKKL